MKVSIVLILTAFIQISSAATFGQKITLKESNASLEKVLNKISAQTNYNIIYNVQHLKNAHKVTVSLVNEDLENALNACLENQSLTYKINDNTVVIVPAVSESSKKPQQSLQTKKDRKGVVKDSKGEPLPGAAIKAKNGASATMTDVNGEFTLKNIANDDVIIISYTGFTNQEIAVKDIVSFNIVLQEDLAKLEEVVVIGYGTVSKKDVSTSVSSLQSKEIKDVPASDFRNALVGRMAGVQVLQTSGDPNQDGGTIRVRGVSTITAGSEPLYVVDGIPLERGLANLNTNDIETIDVLKDAASAAIYGSRGSNGVIIITTKKGTQDRLTVQYDGYYGIQEVSKKIDLLDAYQFAQYAKDGHDGAYLTNNPTASADDPNEMRSESYEKNPIELFPYINGVPGLTNTDWQDAIFRPAPLMSHNISLSGKNNNTRYYTSVNYLKRDGIIINSDFEKMSARLNLDYSNKKFKFGVNMSPSYSKSNNVDASGSWGIVQTALAMPPIWPVYNSDGSYNYQGNGHWRIGNDYQHQNLLNPVAMANLPTDQVNRLALVGRIFAEYEILNGLSYSFSMGGDYYGSRNNQFRPSTLPLLGHQYLDRPSNPTAYVSSANRYNWLLESKLNYKKTFKQQHNLDVILVHSAQKDTYQGSNVSATDFPNDYVQTINAGIVTSGSSNVTEWTIESYLARAQYGFKGKYIASAAIRADGSSRFGANNRWGYFPSTSLAWRISEEDFFKNSDALSFINDFKLRGSYGVTGNFNIGNYDHIASMGKEDYIIGAGQGEQTAGYKPDDIDRPDLKWEKNKTFNFGLDAQLWKGLLSFSAEYYDAQTSDMLLTIPVPHITGHSTSLINIGGVNNKGFEFLVSSRKQFKNDFSYNISANFARNINKVTALGPQNTPIIESTSGNSYYITKVGGAIGSYYALVQDGIFATKEQLNLYPHFDNTRVGDFRFVDVDGDGVMDVDKDRAIIGNYMPDFTYGFNGSVGYKNFDLNFNIQGSYGGMILNNNHRYLSNMEGSVNGTTLVLNRWRSESDPGDGNTNKANRKATGYNTRGSTWHFEDASYLRLQNVSLGYNLPDRVAKKVHTRGIRVYVSGQNLLTITGYSGYNPEVSLRNSSTRPGEDYGTYPLARIFSTGLNITL